MAELTKADAQAIEESAHEIAKTLLSGKPHTAIDAENINAIVEKSFEIAEAFHLYRKKRK